MERVWLYSCGKEQGDIKEKTCSSVELMLSQTLKVRRRYGFMEQVLIVHPFSAFWFTETATEQFNFLIFVNASRLLKSLTPAKPWLWNSWMRLQLMTIFLALNPHSVCNGAVKTKPLKQLEIDLLNAVNDSGYLSYGSTPKIDHRPWLVSMQQWQPRPHLEPEQRETLKMEPFYHLSGIQEQEIWAEDMKSLPECCGDHMNTMVKRWFNRPSRGVWY